MKVKNGERGIRKGSVNQSTKTTERNEGKSRKDKVSRSVQ